MNIVLVIICLIVSPGVLWYFWSLAGWGIGLIFHGLGVFVFSKSPGKKWEEQKIKEVMKEMDDSE